MKKQNVNDSARNRLFAEFRESIMDLNPAEIKKVKNFVLLLLLVQDKPFFDFHHINIWQLFH